MKRAEIVQITTTCGDAGQADRLVKKVIEERLAACGQIDAGVQSRYHWQGQIAEDTEWRCTFKTSVAQADACAIAILKAHPYDTPELILATVTASEAYAAWVVANVQPAGTAASSSETPPAPAVDVPHDT